MTLSFPNKLVAVLNEKIEPGVGMNALAHACLAFDCVVDWYLFFRISDCDVQNASVTAHFHSSADASQLAKVTTVFIVKFDREVVERDKLQGP